MNRLNLLLSKVAFGAILLFLVSSSAVYGQVTYTLTGTLNLASGTDPFDLSGTQITATTTISQTMAPIGSASTSASSSNTYSGMTVTVTSSTLGSLNCDLTTTPATSLTLTDNVDAADTVAINNCSILGLATITASATIPEGNMITAVPAAVPLTEVTGTVDLNLSGKISAYNFSNATIVATGTPPPAVVASPASWLTPTAAQGSTATQSQAITFTAPVAPAVVSFTTSVSPSSSWLSVSPAADNTSNLTPMVTITVNPTGLTAATYSGTVTLSYGTSGVAATVIPVTFIITPLAVTFGGPSSMSFAYTLGDAAPPSSQPLMITSSPSSTTANAAVTSGNSWLSVFPTSGATPATFTVSVNTSGLTAQTYNGNIQITGNATNSPFNVPVSFTVSGSTLTVPTTTVPFTYTIGTAAPTAQLVSISGTPGIAYSTVVATNSGGSWLAATPSGTVPSSVSISINTAGLTTPGTYTGSVTVNSTGATGSGTAIPVTLNVVGPTLTATPSQLNFSVPLGSSTEPGSLPISVGDASSVTFTATPATTSGGSWLSVSPGGGSASGSVNVSVVNTSGLAAGTYNGTVTISATGATSQVVNVSLTVAAVTVSTTSLNFAFQTGGTAPAAQPVNIGGTSGLGFTATPATTAGGSWLSVNPTSGAISTSSSISVSVITTGLAPNTYTGTVTVAAPGAVSQVINVSFVVSNNATLSASPSSLNFAYTIGGTAPAVQVISVGGSSGLTFTATPATTSGGSWLSASPVSPGTVPGSANVSIVTTGLTTPGTYNGTVTVGATGATSQVVNVTLVVSSTVTATPTSLSFNYTIGGAAPTAQSLTIGGSPGLTFTATPATTSGGSWLAASVGAGTVPGSANVSIVTTGLTTPGTFSGSVTIGSTGATAVVVPVTLVVSPTLTATPTSLSFTYTIGGAAPAAQTLTIGGTPGITFTATPGTTSGGAWLAAAIVSPGTAPGSVNVSIVTTGLTTPGTFNGTVTIGATGATPVAIPVTLVVSPTVTATPTSLTFNYAIGGTAPAAQSLTIGGTSGTTFTAVAGTTTGGAWLSATPVSPGTVSGSASVSIITTGLTTPGTFSGTVTIGATGATSVIVPVTLNVSAPTVTAAPSSLNFTYQIGGTAPAAQALTIGGTAGLTFTVTPATTPAGGTWLSAVIVGPGTTTPGSVSASINGTTLTTVGTYTGSVTIGATGATSQVVAVTVVVTTAPITASPTSLSFTYTLGGTAPMPQGVNIDGGSGLAFTAAPGSGASWLSVSPTSGNLPILLSVTVNPTSPTKLTVGTYTSSIIVTAAGAPNSPFSVPVTLIVSGGTTTITVTPLSLSFAATTGATTAPPSQTANVTSGTPTAVSVSSVGGTWLSASISAGTTPAVVTVSTNPANLSAGTYTGTVAVTAASATDSPQNIAIKLVVSAPSTLTATPASLSFTYAQGGAAPATQTISVTAGAATAISVTGGKDSWVVVSSSGVSTPATLTVNVNTASLPVGNYNAIITVSGPSATNSPLIIPVTMVVSGKPTLSDSPTSLTFTGQTGGASPAAQSITLTGSSALPFSIAGTLPSWLGVSASSGTTPSTLVATVNTKGMTQGSYQGAITITGTASNAPFVIPVTLNLTASQVVTGPTISSIVNAASYDAGGFSPGAIVSLFGSFLGPQKGVAFEVNSKGSLDNTLGGVTVTAGGLPTIPLFVQNGQINLILPYNLGTSGPANVQVQYNNLTSAEFNITLAPADVQIFTANMSGSGPGSILNQDFSINTASNPAAPNSVVQVYGTGGGLLSPSVTAGNVAGDTLSWVTAQYSATVNGENATVLYAGSAPGLVYGVYQFNVQLPADLITGPQNIVLTVAGSASQSDVTVFVK